MIVFNSAFADQLWLLLKDPSERPYNTIMFPAQGRRYVLGASVDATIVFKNNGLG
jgi:hypothetical protein